MVTLDLDDAIFGGAARPAQCLQLLGHGLQVFIPKSHAVDKCYAFTFASLGLATDCYLGLVLPCCWASLWAAAFAQFLSALWTVAFAAG